MQMDSQDIQEYKMRQGLSVRHKSRQNSSLSTRFYNNMRREQSKLLFSRIYLELILNKLGRRENSRSRAPAEDKIIKSLELPTLTQQQLQRQLPPYTARRSRTQLYQSSPLRSTPMRVSP
jgi:hypothetical protein